MSSSSIAVLTLTVLIAGCSRSVTFTTPDGKVVVAQSGKPGQSAVTVTGKDGSKMTIDASGTKLPDGYPKDMPVASPAKILMATSVNDGKTLGFHVMLESTETAENLAAFYKKGLADNGWTIGSTTVISAQMTMLTASKDNREVGIQILESEGKRTVTQTVATKN
jgi:hypothetical protein